ncbi:MAG: hypothetical protein R2932_04070 [Caldilineaceae bacterium]
MVRPVIPHAWVGGVVCLAARSATGSMIMAGVLLYLLFVVYSAAAATH